VSKEPSLAVAVCGAISLLVHVIAASFGTLALIGVKYFRFRPACCVDAPCGIVIEVVEVVLADAELEILDATGCVETCEGEGEEEDAN
jgi:hypothetical protein